MGGRQGAGTRAGTSVSLPIVLRDEAQAEFDEAFDWYDARRVGLGLAFVGAVQEVFDRVAANPRICRTVYADVRRGVVSRFPYCVFYRTHADRIEVLSVFYTSRDPAIWQGRV